ncbi:hypothetical protein ACQPTN_21985 [Bradyrhizobium sp. 13971]
MTRLRIDAQQQCNDSVVVPERRNQNSAILVQNRRAQRVAARHALNRADDRPALEVDDMQVGRARGVIKQEIDEPAILALEKSVAQIVIARVLSVVSARPGRSQPIDELATREIVEDESRVGVEEPRDAVRQQPGIPRGPLAEGGTHDPVILAVDLDCEVLGVADSADGIHDRVTLRSCPVSRGSSLCATRTTSD